jgi:hypothetical protein
LQVEKELSEICASILQLLDEHLIPTASTGESKVFYLKMKGDYHRYLAEFKTGADRKEAAEHTLLAYKAAQVRCCCVSCNAAAVCAQCYTGHACSTQHRRLRSDTAREASRDLWCIMCK